MLRCNYKDRPPEGTAGAPRPPSPTPIPCFSLDGTLLASPRELARSWLAVRTYKIESNESLSAEPTTFSARRVPAYIPSTCEWRGSRAFQRTLALTSINLLFGRLPTQQRVKRCRRSGRAVESA